MFEKLKNMVETAHKIAVFTHENPDGDALGSSYAFALGLLQLGKKVNVFLGDFKKNTKEYREICGTEMLSPITPDECDLKIAVDCADEGRVVLGGAEFSGVTAAIDHHITHKPYADETVVVDAPATGEIIFDILEEWGIEITPEIANDIYIAIACDTGNFKYSSTTAKTHRVIAELIEYGADFAKISRELFYKLSGEYLALYKIALERLEFFADKRACLMYISDEDFKMAGLDENEAGDIVTLPSKIIGVEAGVFIRNRGKGYKVSLRSNEFVNVSEIAVSFGGGGHIRAAGFSSEMPLDELKKDVCSKIEEALKR